MIHVDDEYPVDYEDIRSVKDVLVDVDWDVVCVFDACRWDAFEERVGGSQPVCSPGDHTLDWTQDIWCDAELDWSDVTYLSASAMPLQAKELDDYGGDIEKHVKEFVLLKHLTEATFGNTIPELMSKEAVNYYEPPMVIHYTVPHTPFIGPNAIQVDIDAFEDRFGISSREFGTMKDYYLPINGLVSADMMRASYLSALDVVWEETQIIRDSFDRVITTSDHGEVLGKGANPGDCNYNTWTHGDVKMNQTRVVPLHVTWEVEL